MKPGSSTEGRKGAGSQARDLESAIAARLGAFAAIDLTYPRGNFVASGHRPARVALLARDNKIEQEFLSTFRQCGGHYPIPELDPASASAPPLLYEFSAPGQSPLLVVDDLQMAAQLGPLFVDWPVSFLAPAKRPASGRGARRRNGLPGFELTYFEEDGARTGYMLAAPAAAPAKRPEPALPDLETIACIERRQLTFSARELIHDGGYEAEGDDNYSWIWTGPSRHFRIVVPRGVAGRGVARRVEVSIVRTENPENLTGLSIQLDGRPVPFTFERWSEQSGKIVVDVPQTDDYTIIGIVVPALNTDKNSGRSIGVSIDKLAVISKKGGID